MSFDNFDEETDIPAADLLTFRYRAASAEVYDDEYDDAPSMVSRQDYSLPDAVRSFVTTLHRAIKDGDTFEVFNLYENSFNKLTEKYYKTAAWPPAEAISPLVDDDSTFVLLYKELYFRHIYSKLQPTLRHRFDSWNNYTALLEKMTASVDSQGSEFDLPAQWMWDIIDEFIYQFQSFCQFKSKLKSRSEDELATLQENADVWSVGKVLHYLHQIVAKSDIQNTLEKEKQGESAPQDADESPSVSKLLGYFCLVGLLRLHSLLGDYYLALKTIECIDLSRKQGLFTRVAACHITLYYYTGFAYLMMRRCSDAIKTFQNILLYIGRTKQYYSRSYQYDQMMKKNEQMYALLAIAVSLCPQRIDESIHAGLRDKYGEKMLRMQRSDEASFEELFAFSCPKFITTSTPTSEDPVNANQAYKLQSKLFLREVRQQQLLPTVRSYLKLYTSLTTAKMAQFLDISESEFRTQVLCMKHKMRQQVWSHGSPLDGKLASSSDFEFYVDKDTVYVADTKVTRHYGEFFIRHINKFEHIIEDLST